MPVVVVVRFELGLGVTVTVKVSRVRVVRTQVFGSEFRRHLPQLSAVLLASRRTIVIGNSITSKGK